MKYEYGYDIWTDMLPYGEDYYHQDAICQSLEKKIHIGKLLIFFCPQVKEERKKKWGQTGN